AVAVDVAPGGAGGPVRVSQTCGRGDVHEPTAAGSVRFVVVQRHAAEKSDEQVVEPVVVVVADRYPHAISGPVEADFFGHVCEGAVTVVAEHPAGGRRCGAGG